MDSVYIVTKSSNGIRSVFHAMIDHLVDNLYVFSSIYKIDLSDGIPSLKIEKEGLYFDEFNERSEPVIWVYFFSDKIRFKKDNIFPVIYESFEYFPVIALRSRDAMFLLQFIAEFLKGTEDYVLINSEIRIVSAESIERHLKDKNYNWQYE